VKEQAVRESIRVPARLEATRRCCRRGGPHRRSVDAGRGGRAWRQCISRAGTRPNAPPTLGASRPSAASTGAGGSTDRARPGDSRSRAGRAPHDRGRGACQTTGRGAIRRGASEGSPDGG
jgi:hypothetical protein